LPSTLSSSSSSSKDVTLLSSSSSKVPQQLQQQQQQPQSSSTKTTKNTNSEKKQTQIGSNNNMSTILSPNSLMDRFNSAPSSPNIRHHNHNQNQSINNNVSFNLPNQNDNLNDFEDATASSAPINNDNSPFTSSQFAQTMNEFLTNSQYQQQQQQQQANYSSMNYLMRSRDSERNSRTADNYIENFNAVLSAAGTNGHFANSPQQTKPRSGSVNYLPGSGRSLSRGASSNNNDNYMTIDNQSLSPQSTQSQFNSLLNKTGRNPNHQRSNSLLNTGGNNNNNNNNILGSNNSINNLQPVQSSSNYHREVQQTTNTNSGFNQQLRSSARALSSNYFGSANSVKSLFNNPNDSTSTTLSNNSKTSFIKVNCFSKSFYF
jgi:hypothetical protein